MLIGRVVIIQSSTLINKSVHDVKKAKSTGKQTFFYKGLCKVGYLDLETSPLSLPYSQHLQHQQHLGTKRMQLPQTAFIDCCGSESEVKV